MATETQDFVSGVFKHAGECFNQAVQTGIAFQKEAGKSWTDAYGRNLDLFRAQFDTVANDAVPAAKNNLERFQGLCDAQVKQGMDMFRQVFGVGQDGQTANVFDRTMETWRRSFDVMQSNMDTLAKANMEVFESFREAGKKVCATEGQKGSGKTAAK